MTTALVLSGLLSACGAPAERDGWSSASPVSRAPMAPIDGPQLTGRAVLRGSTPQAVTTVGDHALVADIEGLAVHRIDDALSPIARVATEGSASDVTVLDDWALVADGDAGLAVVDIRDPAAPDLVYTLPLDGGVRRVSSHPRIGVVALSQGPQVHIIAPAGLAQRPQVTSLTFAGRPNAAAFAGDDLWIASRTEGLYRLRRSQGLWRRQLVVPSLRAITGLVNRDNWLITASADRAIRILDLTQEPPLVVGTLELEQQVADGHLIGDLFFLRGRRLVVADETADSRTTQVVDVSDPRHPRVVADLERALLEVVPTRRADQILAVDASPGLALLSAEAPFAVQTERAGVALNQLERFPTGMAVLGYYDVSPRTFVTSGLRFHDSRRSVRWLDAEGREVDATDIAPADQLFTVLPCGSAPCQLLRDGRLCRRDETLESLAPLACTALELPNTAAAFEVTANRLWLGAPRRKLTTVEFTPGLATAAPVQLPAGSARATRLALANGLLVAVDGSGAVLSVYDISTGRPARMGEFALQSRALALEVVDSTAWVGLWPGGLQVIDISDPARPRERHWHLADTPTFGVSAMRSQHDDCEFDMALATGVAGASIYCLGTGANDIRALGHAPTSGLATDVLLTESDLWVADTTAVRRFSRPEIRR